MKTFIVTSLLAFIIPVGIFAYVMFFGYPSEIWALILIGTAFLMLFGGKKK